jgi:hypothetical protein
VFVGTVESIENPPPDFDQAPESNVDMRAVDQSGYSRYHFRIDEKISGAQAMEVDVFSGRGAATAVTTSEKASNTWYFLTSQTTES